MPALVTLDEAKRQLNLSLDRDDHDDQVLALITQASAIVLDYLKYPAWLTWAEGSPGFEGSPAGTDDPNFVIVKAAVLHVTTNLFLHRGDEGSADGPISARVANLLMRLRDPALR